MRSKPVLTVTEMKLLMTFGTPTVKVSSKPVLAKASEPTDSVKVRLESNVTLAACAALANEKTAHQTASAETARTNGVSYRLIPSEGSQAKAAAKPLHLQGICEIRRNRADFAES